MAEKILVVKIDDMDGTEIADGEAHELLFSVNGTEYRMDLSKKNMDKFTKAVSPFTEKAKKVRSRRGPKRTGTSMPTEQIAQIREWAKNNGYDISDRGRIPIKVVEDWELAHAS